MNKIITTIEKPFLNAFTFGGVVSNCIEWMQYKYDLAFCKKKTPEEESKRLATLSEEERTKQIENDKKWDDFYKTKLPQLIKNKLAAFDRSVIEYLDSPLMDEIEANIRACDDDRDRERYVFKLLKPFKEISDILTPIARIKELEKDIKEREQQKRHY